MKRSFLIAMGLVLVLGLVSCSETTTGPDEYTSADRAADTRLSTNIGGTIRDGFAMPPGAGQGR